MEKGELEQTKFATFLLIPNFFILCWRSLHSCQHQKQAQIEFKFPAKKDFQVMIIFWWVFKSFFNGDPFFGNKCLEIAFYLSPWIKFTSSRYCVIVLFIQNIGHGGGGGGGGLVVSGIGSWPRGHGFKPPNFSNENPVSLVSVNSEKENKDLIYLAMLH